MHWHPFTSSAVGQNAVIGVFLDTYDVELTNDSLKFPDNNILGPSQEYVEGETKCDGEDAELSVKAWGNFTDTDGGKRYIANMDRVHVDNDGMVFGIYFTPKDADQQMPPWASDLPALGAVDTTQLTPDDLIDSASTVPGSTVAGGTAPDSTVAGSTPGEGTVSDGTVTPNAAGSTAPASSAPPTTSG
jgi:hypothetical protein